ncbi:MAG TPA: cytochrome c peroxidase [Woeseiaceae bacterium]|nr:cytochrome c peroxidase [Woeseiaceae bacterium]
MIQKKLLIGCAVLAVLAAPAQADRWTAEEVALLSDLSLAELEAAPADPTNRFADDPRAAALGERLFFDMRLSSNGVVSCATCHAPDREFQDGIALAKGVGQTSRRTMPLAATAYSPFLFWDGRKDSLWAQALGPLESPVEHGGTRAQYAHEIDARYRQEYERTFGPLPVLAGIPEIAGPVDDPEARGAWAKLTEAQRDAVTAVFVNIGKAIAAYERGIRFAPSRFDRYVDGLKETRRAPAGILSKDEVAGLRLFIGKASCINCHNGPLLTNNDFHNTGVPARPGLPPDAGRLAGADGVLRDEFNCRSRWSDAPSECAELEFMVTGQATLEGAFKVPSLRNAAERAPYMHAGQFGTLAQVIEHYDAAPLAALGQSELEPLRLTARERRQLEAFLRSLSAPVRQ